MVVFGDEVRISQVQTSCGPRCSWPSPCPPATPNPLRNLPPCYTVLPINDIIIMALTLVPCCGQVSCGPYHTAAITCDGQLFTWGNGLFGKLGHGSSRSEYSPRRVAAFEGYCVTQVSCGWWHTAAVAAPRCVRLGWRVGLRPEGWWLVVGLRPEAVEGWPLRVGR